MKTILYNIVNILTLFFAPSRLCGIKSVPIREIAPKSRPSQNFFSQNEPNSNESDFTANYYGSGGYNDFSQKIHQKNEPKQTQLKPISKAWNAPDMIESCRLVVAVVVKNKSITSCYPVKNRNNQAKNKKMKSKANLTSTEFTLTREMNGAYNNLHQNDHKKAKPIQTQSKANFMERPNY